VGPGGRVWKAVNLSEVPKRLIALAVGGLALLVVGGLALVILQPRPEELPQVSSSVPQDGEEHVLGSLPITVTFAEELSGEQQDEIRISLDPDALFILRWLDSRRVRLTPTEGLEFSTRYTVSVVYKGEGLSSFSFHTLETTAEQLEQDIQEQAEGDELFAEAQVEWYENNPWYSQLPITSDDFTIVYEPDTTKFRIRLTLGSSPTGAEIGAAKNRALERLELIGISLDQYEYYVIVD